MEKSPDAFRTISEVAELLETPAHVLRFWESRFPQIRPVKRAGGRRYYRPADVALLTGIKRLLHDEGMTIRGVQKILREQGVRHVSGTAEDTSPAEDDAALEAALAGAGGAEDSPAPIAEPLPPAEAEVAQVIALQAALTPPLAATGDLFSPGPGAGPVTEPSQMTDESTPVPAPEDVEEAPMALWAEAEDDADEGASLFPGLKVTRIGHPPAPEPPAPEAPAPEPPTRALPPLAALPEEPAEPLAPPLAATLAARLRQMAQAPLSQADRAAFSLVRARARSLRDRLDAAPRAGF